MIFWLNRALNTLYPRALSSSSHGPLRELLEQAQAVVPRAPFRPPLLDRHSGASRGRGRVPAPGRSYVTIYRAMTHTLHLSDGMKTLDEQIKKIAGPLGLFLDLRSEDEDADSGGSDLVKLGPLSSASREAGPPIYVPPATPPLVLPKAGAPSGKRAPARSYSSRDAVVWDSPRLIDAVGVAHDSVLADPFLRGLQPPVPPRTGVDMNAIEVRCP